MDEQLKERQQAYDRTWENGLEAGKEQRGNLDVNLEFLDDLTGELILRKHPRDCLSYQGCRVSL